MLRLQLLALVLIALPAAGQTAVEISPQRQAELIYLLRHDCGSCHGMRLQGGLGPNLTAERLQPWSRKQLAITILHGRPGTPMPPWHPFLSEADAQWLAGQLKRGIEP